MFQPGSRRMLHSPSIARTTIVSGGGSRLSTVTSNLMGERPYCCVHDAVRPVGYVDAVHVLVVSANRPCTPRLAAAVPRWIEAPGGIVWQTKGSGRSRVPDGRKVQARHEFRQTGEPVRLRVPETKSLGIPRVSGGLISLGGPKGLADYRCQTDRGSGHTNEGRL